MDDLYVNNDNIVRILYDTNTIKHYSCHDSTLKIKRVVLKNMLDTYNTKFDLICMDTFHDYDTSVKDFDLMSSYLSDAGFIVSHDCFPGNENLASPTYQIDAWCGETYVALVNFAYNNPNYFYGLFNIDTGIGVISKTCTEGFKNNFDREKQQIFLSLKNDQYKYFVENCNDMINVVTP